jgi:hypothetical protein
MHGALTQFIDKKFGEAYEFVIRHMPVTLTTDQIYEGLVGESHVLAAFKEATKYLPPSTLSRRVNLIINGQTLVVSLRLQPTELYPMFLIPKYDLKVTQESMLGQALAISIQVSREWEMLAKTWVKFKTAIPDAHVLGFLFPWLRETVLNFHFGLLDVSINKKERQQIEREVLAIQRRTPPKRFPRLSIELNQVCQSGKRLFGQYRMLEAAMTSDDLTRAPLNIDTTTHLSPAWLDEHIDECINDWHAEVLKMMALSRAKPDGTSITSNRRRKLFGVN